MIHLTAIPPRKLLRHCLPMVALVVCGGLLWQRISVMDGATIRTTFVQVAVWQWIFAALATWVSFQAIGRYDAVWHRLMGTRVTADAARRAGVRAIAVAQLLGFGAVTASLVRWRCLPSLSLWHCTQLSFAVTLTFAFCWAIFAVLAVYWLDVGATFIPDSPIFLFAALFIGVAAIAMARRKFTPSLKHIDVTALMIWTAVDLFFAALALYILLPAGVDIAFVPLLAAFVLALGAGLISNAPGGAGAFDLSLLALLPLASPEPLVAAIIAFRIVYYLVPAGLALMSIARPIRKGVGAHAAWGLSRQTGQITALKGKNLFLGELPFVSVSIGPAPRGSAQAPQIAALRLHAVLRAKTPALYNCDPRLAKHARDLGWFVRRTAMEAIIRPQTWSTAGSKQQTLRRKLRQAANAGIHVAYAENGLPLEEMTVIAHQWAQSHGGEHGFSMGQYCPEYVSQQRVFLIKNGSHLIGFVSFLEFHDAWHLDLIRHMDGSPDGGVHAAIATAINVARTKGITSLSLATVPDPRYTPAFWSAKRTGLIQFKRSFTPIWVPRYHAAPNRVGFWLTGIVIGLAIHRPFANLAFNTPKLRHIVTCFAPKHRFPIEVNRQT